MLLPLLLLWPLAAFGGRSPATAVSFALTCIVCALAGFPRVGGPLDRSLIGLLAIVALQLVPLPPSVVAMLSPHASEVRDALAIERTPAGAFVPLTLSVSATSWAGLVLAGTIALFWFARNRFSRGSVRRTVRAVCGLGFGVSLLAIAQAATAGREIYWNFKTEFEGPLPFGPFVNRNHFATWMIMAVPLTFGYIAARANRRGPRDGPRHTRAKLVDLIDPRMAWLMVAAGTMLVALLLSLSRSGAVACGVSGVLTVALARHRLDARQRRWLLTAAAVVALLALGWADMPALQQRFAGTRTGVADRMVIWRDTMPVLGDFWLTGTGAGTYPSAMLVYQKADRAVYFNQAHNHYLQVAVEGGLLMVVALAVALGAFVRTASKRLRHDEAGLHWIRIGAAAGLGAAALQSAWETGLVMPANAALAAVLAALLVHERSLQPESASR